MGAGERAGSVEDFMRNPFREGVFVVDTSTTGVYVATERSITHRFLSDEETSSGLLVGDHFEDAEGALFCAWLLREGRCHESVASYQHTEADLEGAPHLTLVLDALERQLDLLTDGYWGGIVAAGGVTGEATSFDWWTEVQTIWGLVSDLRDGRYHESTEPRYAGLRGIPRIETTGRRLVDAIMDLVWRMDGGAPSMDKELYEKLRKMDERIFGAL